MRFIYMIIGLLVSHMGYSTPTLHSKQAILIDATTGTVLFEKNADHVVPPSSMSKMMTVYMIFKALASHKIHEKTLYPISEKAWRKGGSKMFVTVGSQVSVEDLLRGVIIQSGNDAAIALAEGYSGSEEVFAQQLTALAHDMGALKSHFVNATGWPDPQHVSTMRDLALIGLRTIRDFPQYYHLYGEKDFSFNNIKQPNRNPLLYKNMGADGLKTGHTDAGGYGVVASAIQGGRRLILAINGAEREKQRAVDAETLMGFGFAVFSSPKVFIGHQEVDRVPVWLGVDETVPICVDQDVYVTLPRADLDHMKVTLRYASPLKAPLKAGDVIGEATITVLKQDKTTPSFKDIKVPLKIMKDVEKVGLWGRLRSSFMYLIKGH